jgi:E3 ubiquitin-protein ligase synoviolin
MNFWSYFYASVGAILSIITYAIYTREQFYPSMLFLTTSKISLVIAGNMALSLTLLFGRISKHIFLGNLRDAETELLLDRAKYTVTETCLALTIFRNELTLQVLGLFGALLFVKSFHWLCSSRMDYLEQIMPVPTSTHIRLTSLMTVLGLCDISVAYYCIKYTITNGKSVLILFGFEFGVLVISVMNLFARYILHLIDIRFTNGLVSKGLYVMLVDLICDALRFLTYVAFFCLVFVYYGLPIHIIREVWVSFYTFQKHAYSFYKYVKLTNNLEQRFENATEEELHSAGDCLICRENMEEGKKLPCSHVFHLGCLRMWLQHQQSCPLCRAEIPLVPPPVRPTPRVVLVEEEEDVHLIDPLDHLTEEEFNEIQSNDNDSTYNSIINDEYTDHQSISINSSINNQKSLNMSEGSNHFPHFFITTYTDLNIYTEANITSTIIRPIVLVSLLYYILYFLI